MNARLTTINVMRQFHKLLWMFVLVLFSLQVMAAGSPVVVNVDNRVKVSFSKVQFDAKKGAYSTLVRINNQSDSVLFFPLRLSFDENVLKVQKVRLLNAKKTGKDGQPYFEFALPKGKLVAGGTTKPVRVIYSVKKDRRKRAEKSIPANAVRSLFASAYHVSAGVELAALAPRAEPYALKADSGRVNVRFSVRLVGRTKSVNAVYLRRKGDREDIAMNDQGKNGDLVAGDNIFGANVIVDTSSLKPDSCLRYEAYINVDRVKVVSAPLNLCVSLFPVRAAASNESEPVVLSDGSKAVADEVLITTVPGVNSKSIQNLASEINAKVVGSILPLDLYQLKLSERVSASQLLSLVDELRKRPEVKFASINAIGTFAYTPSDTEFASQHGLQLVRADDVWDIGATGSGVTVIVLDSGLDKTHADFGTSPGNCQLAADDCGGTNDDTLGHGTEVAGVLAAKTNNALGVAGVSYGAKIHSIQLSADAAITDLEMIQGFTDAATYGLASVINASFSTLNGLTNWTPVCSAIDSAVLNGGVPVAVVVNAVGNNGFSGNFYPARCNDLNAGLTRKDLFITVASSASVVTAACGSVAIDQRCSDSNYGAWVDMAAPGSEIRTTAVGGAYASPSGNSFSAPMVAGAAAILNSCGVALDQIESTLRTSASVTVPFPDASSAPRLDIYLAMQSLNQTPTGVTPSIFSLNENIDTTGGYDVGTLSAVDTDTCDSYTYSINGGADAASFSINPPNTLRINAGVLDYETKSSYAVTVRVTDFFGATFDQAMTVNVNDLNEAPTAVVLTNQVPSTPENGGSIKVADISVTDDALGTNVLSLGGTDAASFNIVGTELYFNGGANYEVKSSYNVAVEVDDVSVGATPDAVQPFTLTIVDANDPATGNPAITGTRTVGQTLTADTSGIADEDGLGAFSYQWRHDVTDIPGAIASTYVLAAADVGEFMSLCVSFTDGGGYSEGPLCSVTDATAVGDPHITTVDGLHYDFQSAGEFVALRDANGMELQLRTTPVSTATPLTDPNSGLTSGVSVNTALAARVGNHRVTYQPDISPGATSGAPVLRVDGVLTTPSADGLDLGGGGSVSSTGNGIQIDFPDGTTVIASSSLWSYYNVWWLHVSVFHTPAHEGIMGARSNGSWLPKLSDGSALGAMPAALHDRYVELYVTFADSWRVTDSTSLFDYANGTSTATFTNKAWPTENGPYVVDSGPVAQPLGLKEAQLACRQVKGKNEKADCVFDVRMMGQKDIAKPHLLAQKIRTGATFIKVRDDRDMDRRIVTFTATVARHAAPARGVIKAKARAKNVPTGWVQFTLNGKNAGKPVKLNSRGQATWKVPRQKVEKQTVGARYIPAKSSIFLPSRILGTARLPVDVKKTTNMRVMKK